MWKVARAAVSAAILSSLLAAPVLAFVVEDNDPRGEDAYYIMQVVPRWDANKESFLWRGERGLGGGLEFSVAADFCERLNFPEKPTCQRVRDVILQAGQKIAGDHPFLRFTDVSYLVAPSKFSYETPEQLGAEIDFLAVDRDVIDTHGPDNAAYASYYVDFAKEPLSTNGVTLVASARLTSSDIIFATDRCFYIDDPEPEEGCIHFGSLVMHEMMHIIALDHVQEFPAYNFDTDDDPENEMVIDCREPMKGLKLSPNVPSRTVSNHFVTGDENWRAGLAPDDRAGLAFLYPVCPDE